MFTLRFTQLFVPFGTSAFVYFYIRLRTLFAITSSTQEKFDGEGSDGLGFVGVCCMRESVLFLWIAAMRQLL